MGKYAKKKNSLNYILPEIIYVLIIILAVAITAVYQNVKFNQQIAELNDSHSEELRALRTELESTYEAKLTDMKQYYEYGGDVSQIEREAECIARVLYGTARNHAESDQRAVVWCVLNRVEHYAHPDTVAEVCEQPKQWMGYSSDNPVLTELYDLALAELKIWYSDGHRPMNNSFFFLTWSSKEILLRDTFEENRSTNYWRMQ